MPGAGFDSGQPRNDTHDAANPAPEKEDATGEEARQEMVETVKNDDARASSQALPEMPPVVPGESINRAPEPATDDSSQCEQTAAPPSRSSALLHSSGPSVIENTSPTLVGFGGHANFSVAAAFRSKIQTYERIIMTLDALTGVICALLVLWVLKHL